MKVIQVGVGGFGRGWVNWLKEEPRATVTGLVDVSPQALAAAREAGGYGTDICFSSLREALASVQADTVVCVTPPESHREVAVQAMRAGLDVISEKPMAASLADCKAMLNAADATGRTCVISQNYRYQPSTWTMADVVRRGRIGRIGQVKIDFYMGVDFHGGFRHEMAYPLLVDMSIHHFDLVRFVTGLDPVSVRGSAWNPRWSNYQGDCSSSVVFEMSDGVRVVYNASWCAKGQFCNWDGNWQIEGEKGTLVYRQGSLELYQVPRLYAVKKTVAVPLKPPPRAGQAYVLADFIRARRLGRRPQTDVHDNIRSIAMVFAAVKAVQTGRKVPVLDRALRERVSGAKVDDAG